MSHGQFSLTADHYTYEASFVKKTHNDSFEINLSQTLLHFSTFKMLLRLLYFLKFHFLFFYQQHTTQEAASAITATNVLRRVTEFDADAINHNVTVASTVKHKFDIDVQQDSRPNILSHFMAHFGSDNGDNKGLAGHTYTTYYFPLLHPNRHYPMRVMELGLGTNNTSVRGNMGEKGRPGASHRGWRAFFEFGEIFGADYDAGVLFTEDRIHTFYVDQENPIKIAKMWSEPLLSENFDLIVEDGKHEFEANVIFFEHSVHKLKENGVYIIEDIVIKKTRSNWVAQFGVWKKKYPLMTFKIVEFPAKQGSVDNVLVVAYKP